MPTTWIPQMNITIKRSDTNSQKFVSKYTSNLNFITVLNNKLFHYEAKNDTLAY